MADIVVIRGMRHELHECIKCGCVVVALESLLARFRKEGGFFYCQNGHAQGWTKEISEDEKVRRERDRLKQENARLAEQSETANRQRLKAEKTLASHKKRSAAGTCQCCNRTFANMARHMRQKHPEFVAHNVVKLPVAS